MEVELADLLSTFDVDPTIINIDYYMKALTHNSYDLYSNYELFEFFGDSIVNLIVTSYYINHIYRDYNDNISVLSNTINRLVSKTTLAAIFDSLDLGKYTRISNQLKPIDSAIKDDIVESVIYATYLAKTDKYPLGFVAWSSIYNIIANIYEDHVSTIEYPKALEDTIEPMSDEDQKSIYTWIRDNMPMNELMMNLIEDDLHKPQSLIRKSIFSMFFWSVFKKSYSKLVANELIKAKRPNIDKMADRVLVDLCNQVSKYIENEYISTYGSKVPSISLNTQSTLSNEEIYVSILCAILCIGDRFVYGFGTYCSINHMVNVLLDDKSLILTPSVALYYVINDAYEESISNMFKIDGNTLIDTHNDSVVATNTNQAKLKQIALGYAYDMGYISTAYSKNILTSYIWEI